MRRALVIGVALLGLGACSYAFVTPPRHGGGPAPSPCTSSLLWPIVDSVLAGIAVLGGIAISSDGCGDGCTTLHDVVIPLSLALPWAVSSYHGSMAVGRCRDLPPPAPPAPFTPPTRPLRPAF